MGWSVIMGSLLGVSKDLIWSKFKLINLILLVDVIGVLVLIGMDKMDVHLSSQYPVGLMVMAAAVVCVVSIVLLVRANENVLLSNRYRLVPISDNKLYFSNLLTTCLIYLYFGLIESIIFVGSLYYFMKQDVIHHLIVVSDMRLELLIKDLAVGILAVLLILTGSTLIHLSMDYFGNFLPMKNQGIIPLAFYVLILTLVGANIYWALTRMSVLGMYRYTGVHNNEFLIVSTIDIVGILISIVVGLYLLKNQAETDR